MFLQRRFYMRYLYVIMQPSTTKETFTFNENIKITFLARAVSLFFFFFFYNFTIQYNFTIVIKFENSYLGVVGPIRPPKHNIIWVPQNLMYSIGNKHDIYKTGQYQEKKSLKIMHLPVVPLHAESWRGRRELTPDAVWPYSLLSHYQ